MYCNLSEGVRKHRAPKGALRHRYIAVCTCLVWICQKAPSAKRCIKTRLRLLSCTSL